MKSKNEIRRPMGGKKLVQKTVHLDLTKVDGNAFAILGNFSRAARRQGWNQQEIDLVLEECKKGDYNHLLATILLYCETPDEDSENSSDSETEKEE